MLFAQWANRLSRACSSKGVIQESSISIPVVVVYSNVIGVILAVVLVEGGASSVISMYPRQFPLVRQLRYIVCEARSVDLDRYNRVRVHEVVFDGAGGQEGLTQRFQRVP